MVRPTLSVVVVVGDGAEQLPGFIHALELQTVDPAIVEVVIVADGSTGDTLGVLDRWRATSQSRIVLLVPPPSEPGGPRNAGLRDATGEWVLFAEPQDRPDRDCFQTLLRFADVHPSIEVVATRPVVSRDGPARARARDLGPRRWGRRGERAADRVVDLDAEPNHVPRAVTATLFRLDRITRAGLRFDEDLGPGAADQQFVASFLVALPGPHIGLVPSARYARGASPQARPEPASAAADDRPFTSVLRRGYVDLFDRARQGSGDVPRWLQHLAIDYLATLFMEDDRNSPRFVCPVDAAPEFHALAAKLCRQIEVGLARRHPGRRLSPVVIDVLERAYREPGWRSDHAERTFVDQVMRMQRIVYRFDGERPAEHFEVGGRPAVVAFDKVRPITYFHRELIRERIVWLASDGDPSMTLDGRPVAIRDAPHSGGPSVAAQRPARWRRSPVRAVIDRLDRIVMRVERLVGATLFRRRFRDAWVLMDRVHDAGDNAERLFEYLRRERPDVNAFFVVDRESADWRRLQASGSRRIVAYGSRTWLMLMLNATWLLSSHTGAAVARHRRLMAVVGSPTWRFGFLQHGVIKDDISRWLNLRHIDLFIVSTEPERASVADDGSNYLVSRKEVRLTGLPRFDRLLALGQARGAQGADLVLVAPTWRSWLLLPLAGDSSRHPIVGDFRGSEYTQRWLAILRSPEIAEAVRRRGWTLGFLPHPNLEPALADLDLPEHVAPLSYEAHDVQELFARSALLVTDYSSVAFNAAYLDRPVVYYQFDRDRIRAGQHLGRPGYFDDERDGFGPVVSAHEAAVAEIVASIERGAEPASVYLERIARTFPIRDGGACARVVAAIEEASRPWGPP